MLKPEEYTMVRYIWKCRNQECKHVFALQYMSPSPDSCFRLAGGDFDIDYYPDKEIISSCTDYDTLRCPKCNARTKGNRVNGVYNASKACSAKCMGATGPSCECSCAGANHGSNHG